MFNNATTDWLKTLNDNLVLGDWDEAYNAFSKCLELALPVDEIAETMANHIVDISDDSYCGALRGFLETWRPVLEEQSDAFIPMLTAVSISVDEQMKQKQLKALKITLAALEVYPESFRENISVRIGIGMQEMAAELHPYLVPILDALRDFPEYHMIAIKFAESSKVGVSPLDIAGEGPTHIVAAFKKAKYLFWRQEPRISTAQYVDMSVNDILKIWSMRMASGGKDSAAVHAKYASTLFLSIGLAENHSRDRSPGSLSSNERREKAKRRAEECIAKWLRKYQVRPA